MTAMQSAKLAALNKLLQAQQLIRECRSLICMGATERSSLQAADEALDQPVNALAPSNTGPSEGVP